MKVDYGRIAEGLCPVVAHGPLERREEFGWCDQCDSGWSISPDEIGLHTTVRVGPVGGSVEDMETIGTQKHSLARDQRRPADDETDG